MFRRSHRKSTTPITEYELPAVRAVVVRGTNAAAPLEHVLLTRPSAERTGASLMHTDAYSGDGLRYPHTHTAAVGGRTGPMVACSPSLTMTLPGGDITVAAAAAVDVAGDPAAVPTSAPISGECRGDTVWL